MNHILGEAIKVPVQGGWMYAACRPTTIEGEKRKNEYKASVVVPVVIPSSKLII